jgi:hypothetical protein
MRKRDWAIALAMALCATILAACGGGGEGDGGGAQAAREEASLEFAACLRAHGVEVEDPQPGQNVKLPDRGPKTKKALAACQGKLGTSGQELSAEEDEELKEGALAFARCMRKEGIDMGDPTFLGPGKFLLDIAGLDTSSPAFEAAQDACQAKMPELDIAGIGG